MNISAQNLMQVLDAIVVIISWLIDVIFLPQIWNFYDATLISMPIILGLSWRIVRVINSKFSNLFCMLCFGKTLLVVFEVRNYLDYMYKAKENFLL